MQLVPFIAFLDFPSVLLAPSAMQALHPDKWPLTLSFGFEGAVIDTTGSVEFCKRSKRTAPEGVLVRAK